MTYKSTPPRPLAAVPQSPEQTLRQLFAEEDEALALVKRIRAKQALARNDYAAEHGLLMRPGLEQLRKVLG